jgi:hypothetical protein
LPPLTRPDGSLAKCLRKTRPSTTGVLFRRRFLTAASI